MLLYPDDIFEKLEFDKIIELTKTYCKGERAKEILNKPALFNQKDRVERMLSEVQELKKMIEDGNRIPLRAYQSIDQPLFWLRKIDFVLEIENILMIYDHIWSVYELCEIFKDPLNKKKYPHMTVIMDQVDFDEQLIKQYSKIFNEEADIKPTASPELNAVVKMINSKQKELNKTFDRLSNEFASQGLLNDNKETLRGGRRVMSVPAENKRKIKGIIHDESSTGRTVFIEPEEVLYINNHLLELEAQKRHEIRKILKELCGMLRPFADDFEIWQKIIVRLDLINAKANLAIQYDGHKPEISDQHILEFKKAYHPLLFLLHEKQNKKVIPFNMNLDREKRVLVISGPNAGGKSVTMKAVGLMCMMVQSGMLIPALPESKLGLFSHILVDIGDQQSLEDDLSTYSSRLKNMEVFLKRASSKSLFLIDEFGSGTDPKLGGAIAEAILDELNRKKSLGLITTHYSNIKMYAYNSPNLINGAMEFNKEELFPTYKLILGKPGSSFAYEIAKSVGLSEKILNKAKNNAGEGAKEIDDLLNDLQEEKRMYEKRLAENEKEKQKLQRLINSYENAYGDLEFKKKKLKLEKKEVKLNELNVNETELNKLIKELKEERKKEKAEVLVQKAEALSKKIKEQKEEVYENLDGLKEEIYYNDDFDPSTLKVGDFVKLRTGGDPAAILSIKKGVASLSMGYMKLNVPIRDLVPAKTPMQINARKSVQTTTVKNPMALESKLDVRGYTMKEAVDNVQEFVDNALMSNIPSLRIIHGKGTGVLRKAILEKLKEYKDIKEVWHPSDESGGNGVTIVDF